MAPYAARQDDRIIVVYGATGSGKSTLIERLTGHTGLAGHGIESTTTSITPFRNEKHDKTCVFIDTPGFDATHGVQDDVTPMIVKWLKKNYKGRSAVTGILYVHPINTTRVNFAANMALHRFKGLLGDDAFKKVVILSTMWARPEKSLDQKEHTESQLKDGFWREWIGKGSGYAKFHPDTDEEAWKIVRNLLDGESSVANVQLARPSDQVEPGLGRKRFRDSLPKWLRGGLFRFKSSRNRYHSHGCL